MNFNIYFLILALSISTYSQELWKLDEVSNEKFYLLGEDTTLTKLKNILLKEESDGTIYALAADYITINYFDESKSFLKDSLKQKFSSYNSNKTIDWWKIYTNSKLQGYLGNRNAICSMDSIVQHSNDSLFKFLVIDKLAEAGQYYYFNFLYSNYYPNSPYKNLILNSFIKYCNNISFKNRTIDFLIQLCNSNNDILIYYTLYAVDPTSLIEIIEQKFKLSINKERLEYFYLLENYDPLNQKNRILFAINNEANNEFRSEYYMQILINNDYFIPKIINTILLKKETETYSINKNLISKILSNYLPANMSEGSNLFSYIDTLISYTNQSYGYKWLKDVNYKDELLLKVNNAQIYLTAGDSLNFRNELEAFQNSVAEVYADSTGSYPKYVSTAAYRFLYYQAQYVLDRLPIKQIDGKNDR